MKKWRPPTVLWSQPEKREQRETGGGREGEEKEITLDKSLQAMITLLVDYISHTLSDQSADSEQNHMIRAL